MTSYRVYSGRAGPFQRDPRVDSEDPLPSDRARGVDLDHRLGCRRRDRGPARRNRAAPATSSGLARAFRTPGAGASEKEWGQALTLNISGRAPIEGWRGPTSGGRRRSLASQAAPPIPRWMFRSQSLTRQAPMAFRMLPWWSTTWPMRIRSMTWAAVIPMEPPTRSSCGVPEATHRRGRRGPVLAEEGQRLGLGGVRMLDGVLRVSLVERIHVDRDGLGRSRSSEPGPRLPRGPRRRDGRRRRRSSPRRRSWSATERPTAPRPCESARGSLARSARPGFARARSCCQASRRFPGVERSDGLVCGPTRHIHAPFGGVNGDGPGRRGGPGMGSHRPAGWYPPPGPRGSASQAAHRHRH